MLHGVLKSLTDKKFGPIEEYFLQRVNKLKQWLKILKIGLDDFPQGRLSPLRSFMLAAQRVSNDPQSYYYRQGRHLDPIGWRRFKKCINECMVQGHIIKKHIESHSPAQKNEAYYHTLHQHLWNYRNCLRIVQNYSPNRYMLERINRLEAAYDAFYDEYHKRWNWLKARLKDDYYELEAALKEQPSNVTLLYYRKRFETTFEDALDETEYNIAPDKLATLFKSIIKYEQEFERMTTLRKSF